MDKFICSKCNGEIKTFYGIANTNMAYGTFYKEKMYSNDPQNVGICEDPNCDLYYILQVRVD